MTEIQEEFKKMRMEGITENHIFQLDEITDINSILEDLEEVTPPIIDIRVVTYREEGKTQEIGVEVIPLPDNDIFLFLARQYFTEDKSHKSHSEWDLFLIADLGELIKYLIKTYYSSSEELLARTETTEFFEMLPSPLPLEEKTSVLDKEYQIFLFLKEIFDIGDSFPTISVILKNHRIGVEIIPVPDYFFLARILSNFSSESLQWEVLDGEEIKDKLKTYYIFGGNS